MWFDINKADFIFSIKFISYILNRVYSILCKSLLHYSIIYRVLQMELLTSKLANTKKRERTEPVLEFQTLFLPAPALTQAPHKKIRLPTLGFRLLEVVFRDFNWLRFPLNWFNISGFGSRSFWKGPASSSGSPTLENILGLGFTVKAPFFVNNKL